MLRVTQVLIKKVINIIWPGLYIPILLIYFIYIGFLQATHAKNPFINKIITEPSELTRATIEKLSHGTIIIEEPSIQDIEGKSGPGKPKAIQRQPNKLNYKKIKKPSIKSKNTPLKKQKSDKVNNKKVVPKIAIVIDDLGIDKALTAKVSQLKPPITMSFISYAKDIAIQAAQARKNGHEIMLHIPMEPVSNIIDPGPNVLLAGLPRTELLASLRWNLSQLSNYIGINNHMGSRFTADLDSMRILVSELNQRNLIFLDSLTTNKSKGQFVARELGTAFIARDIFLDNKDSILSIEKQLVTLTKIAKLQGHAVAIGHPRNNTIEVLSKWLQKVDKREIQIVTISSLSSKRASNQSN